jgi:DNA repair protein RadD
MFQLRPYQQRVVDAIRASLNQGMISPCASVATGGGKTIILSELARSMIERGHRVCVLTHVRELIGQVERTAVAMLGRDKVGVIAAGLNRNDPMRPMQICQIQTVGRRPHVIGPVRVCIIDENQQVNHEGGQYLKVIEALRVMTPDMRLIGLSATPFRTTTGLIYGPGRMFQECVERVGMRELIDAGYLTPIVGKTGDKDFKVEGVHMRGGDFVPSELEDYMTDEGKIRRATADFLARTADRQRVLVFTCGLKHNKMLLDEIKKVEYRAESVDGTMPDGQRDAILKRFRDGVTKYLFNCAILTTGYDDPGIDGIVMLRPTRSPGLLLQCAGRGLRKQDGKANCLFLDYGNCLQHLGPLDTIEESITQPKKKKEKGAAPTKVCDECNTVLAASAMVCTTCGKEFPRNLKHEEKAADVDVLSGDQTADVASIRVRKHAKPDRPTTLRIDYISPIGLMLASEFLSISPEANVYARRKSMQALASWPGGIFRLVGDTLYSAYDQTGLTALAVDDIVRLAMRLPPPAKIKIRRDGKYFTVVSKQFA